MRKTADRIVMDPRPHTNYCHTLITCTVPRLAAQPSTDRSPMPLPSAGRRKQMKAQRLKNEKVLVMAALKGKIRGILTWCSIKK